MAHQTINVGTVANDGTGDDWRTAMQKTNSNFDQTYPSDALVSAGDMKYDSVTFHTMEILGDLGNKHQVGQENYILVTNKTGITVGEGVAVRITGYDSATDNQTFSLSDASTTDTAEFDGLTTTTMVEGQVGLVVPFGRVNDLDTTGFTAGDELYVSDTVPGGIVNVEPNIKVIIGHAGKINASTGFITVLRVPIEISVFGGFSLLADLTFGATGTPIVIPFDSNDEVAGITHSVSVSNDEFTIDSSGVYQITLEPQLNRTSGSSSATMDAWPEKDTGGGFVVIPNSNVQRSAGTAGATGISPLTITRRLAAGDKLRFRSQVSDTNLFMDFIAIAGSVPATPACLLNIVRVGP